MDDVNAFLNWYLSPFSRVGRKVFNMSISLALLPFLFMSFYGAMDMADKLASSMSSNPMGLMDMLQGMSAEDAPFPWDKFLKSVVFTLLVPLFMMRARDAVYPEWMAYVIGAHAALGIVALLSGVSFGIISALLGLAFFVITTLLCFTPTRFKSLAEREAERLAQEQKDTGQV